MARERLQLSLRFDERRELLDAVRKQARLSGMTLTEFVVMALENALEEPGQAGQDRQDKIDALEMKMVEVEERLENLEDQIEDTRDDLRTVINRPAPVIPNTLAITQQVLERLTSYNPVTITDLENLKQRIHAFDINRQADRRKHAELIEGLQNAAAILQAQVQELKSGLATVAQVIAQTEPAPAPTKKGRGGKRSPKAEPAPTPPETWKQDALEFLSLIERWEDEQWEK